MIRLTAKTNVCGYVLAGGGSTRFGRDKATVQIDHNPMLLRTKELLESVLQSAATVIASPEKYVSMGIAGVADRWPGEGPLGGIITALLTSAATNGAPDWNLIVGCDMPFLSPEWLTYLVERVAASHAEVVVPQSTGGLEPLCACWRTDAAPKLERAFASGVRKITEAIKRLKIKVIDETDCRRFDAAGRLFWNMNTLADYDEARRILQMERA
jgi:molybdenum cofactor guanylyltransferase